MVWTNVGAQRGDRGVPGPACELAGMSTLPASVMMATLCGRETRDGAAGRHTYQRWGSPSNQGRTCSTLGGTCRGGVKGTMVLSARTVQGENWDMICRKNKEGNNGSMAWGQKRSKHITTRILVIPTMDTQIGCRGVRQ